MNMGPLLTVFLILTIGQWREQQCFSVTSSSATASNHLGLGLSCQSWLSCMLTDEKQRPTLVHNGAMTTSVTLFHIVCTEGRTIRQVFTKGIRILEWGEREVKALLVLPLAISVTKGTDTHAWTNIIMT